MSGSYVWLQSQKLPTHVAKLSTNHKSAAMPDAALIMRGFLIPSPFAAPMPCTAWVPVLRRCLYVCVAVGRALQVLPRVACEPATWHG